MKMKPIKMGTTVLIVGRGGMSVIMGDDERVALRIMQMMEAEDDGDISLYEEDLNIWEEE